MEHEKNLCFDGECCEQDSSCRVCVCVCGGGGLFSGSLDMLAVPSHMLLQAPTALAELRLGERRMYFWKGSVAPSCALLGLGLARLKEGQRGEGQKMKGSLE